MHAVLIDPVALKQAAGMTAGDERMDLSGVHVDGEGNLTATDGHRLIHFTLPDGARPDPADFPGERSTEELALPLTIHRADALAIARLWHKPKAHALAIASWILLERNGQGVRASAYNGTVASLTFQPITAPFPDWRRCSPAGNGDPVLTVGFNAELLAETARAAAAATDEPNHLMRLDFYGVDKAMVLQAGNGERKVFALLMPVRLPKE